MSNCESLHPQEVPHLPPLAFPWVSLGPALGDRFPLFMSHVDVDSVTHTLYCKYMYLWAQPPSHQVLMRVLYIAAVPCVADGVGLDLDYSCSAGLPLKCANSCTAWLCLLQEPHQGPFQNTPA